MTAKKYTITITAQTRTLPISGARGALTVTARTYSATITGAKQAITIQGAA